MTRCGLCGEPARESVDAGYTIEWNPAGLVIGVMLVHAACMRNSELVLPKLSGRTEG